MRLVLLVFLTISLVASAFAADDMSTIEQLKKKQQETIDKQNTEEFLNQSRATLTHNLEQSLIGTLESVYDTLKEQGIVFEDIRPSLDELNYAYRLAGASESTIVRSKDDAKFAVISGFLTDYPVVVPAGIDRLVTLRIDYKAVDVDSQGNMAEDCYASIFTSFFGKEVFGTKLGRYTCADILSHANSGAVTSAFASWLLKNINQPS